MPMPTTSSIYAPPASADIWQQLLQMAAPPQESFFDPAFPTAEERRMSVRQKLRGNKPTPARDNPSWPLPRTMDEHPPFALPQFGGPGPQFSLPPDPTQGRSPFPWLRDPSVVDPFGVKTHGPPLPPPPIDPAAEWMQNLPPSQTALPAAPSSAPSINPLSWMPSRDWMEGGDPGQGSPAPPRSTPQQVYTSPVGPEAPPLPPASSAPGAPPVNPMQQWMEMLKGFNLGGAAGAPSGMPGYKARSLPQYEVPKLAAPVKPDYTEADKLIEQGKPAAREESDAAMMLLMGMLSGFDPRPGESFGLTLGRMAGPGMKGYMTAEEKNKDIRHGNKSAEAEWNMRRGGTLSQRADAAAALAQAAQRIEFDNARAGIEDMWKRFQAEGSEDDRGFNRWATGAQIGNQSRTAAASEMTAKSRLMRDMSAAFGDGTGSPNFGTLSILGNVAADIAANKQALPPGLEIKDIRAAAETQAKAVVKGGMPGLPAYDQAFNHFMTQEVQKALLAMPRAALDAYIRDHMKTKNRMRPQTVAPE